MAINVFDGVGAEKLEFSNVLKDQLACWFKNGVGLFAEGAVSNLGLTAGACQVCLAGVALVSQWTHPVAQA